MDQEDDVMSMTSRNELPRNEINKLNLSEQPPELDNSSGNNNKRNYE
jgi:hypothetical protein